MLSFSFSLSLILSAADWYEDENDRLSSSYYDIVNRGRDTGEEEQWDEEEWRRSNGGREGGGEGGERGEGGEMGERGEEVMVDGVMMSEDESPDEEQRDLDRTVYWGDKGMSAVTTAASSSPSPRGGLAKGGSNNSSPDRRVSFADDVWVQEIPRVPEENLHELFYSEADIDGMYAEAEDEVLSATIPMIAAQGGQQSSTQVATSSQTGFNSTI